MKLYSFGCKMILYEGFVQIFDMIDDRVKNTQISYYDVTKMYYVINMHCLNTSILFMVLLVQPRNIHKNPRSAILRQLTILQANSRRLLQREYLQNLSTS